VCAFAIFFRARLTASLVIVSCRGQPPSRT